MADKVQFEQLLQTVSPEDTDKLKAELEDLQAEEEAIQEKLTEVKGLIREVEGCYRSLYLSPSFSDYLNPEV